MKRKPLLHILLIVLSSFLFTLTSNAQCSYSGTGFPPVDSLACVVNGQSTDIYIPYKCFDAIYATYTDSLGNVMLSDRMMTFKIESLSNVPCGLSLDINSSQNPIARGQTGCLHLHGTAQDTAGYYKIKMTASFKVIDVPIDMYTHQNVPLEKYVPDSRLLVIRLKNSGDSCNPQSEDNKVYNNSSCN